MGASCIWVVGGLPTSTIFTLLSLPVWYTALEDIGGAALRKFLFRGFGARAPLPADRVLANLD